MNKILKNYLVFNLILSFPLLINSSFAQTVKISDYEKKITNSFKLKSVSEKIARDDLIDQLKDFIIQTRPYRIVGTSGHAKAQNYIENELKKLSNGKLEVQNFALEKGDGKNFIWKKTGVNNGVANVEHIVLLTHFDAKKIPNLKEQQEYQSADASASGTALMLVMAKLFNELEMPKTVELVFLDAIENQKKGIWQYLDKYKNTNAIYIDINSITHDSKLQDKTKSLYNMGFYFAGQTDMKKKAIYEQFLTYGKSHYPQLKLQNLMFSQSTSFDLDDVFKASNLSLFVLTHDRENDINQRLGSTNDFIETLNFETYFFVYKFITSNILAFNYDISK